MRNYRYFKPFKLRETKSYNNVVGFILKREIFGNKNLEFFFSKDVLTSCNKDIFVAKNYKNLNAFKITDNFLCD